MKSVNIRDVKDGGKFKRSKAMRAIWWKKIRRIPYSSKFTCTSTNSEKSIEIDSGTVVYVKD